MPAGHGPTSSSDIAFAVPSKLTCWYTSDRC
jgi:hypothetical protein